MCTHRPKSKIFTRFFSIRNSKIWHQIFLHMWICNLKAAGKTQKNCVRKKLLVCLLNLVHSYLNKYVCIFAFIPLHFDHEVWLRNIILAIHLLIFFKKKKCCYKNWSNNCEALNDENFIFLSQIWKIHFIYSKFFFFLNNHHQTLLTTCEIRYSQMYESIYHISLVLRSDNKKDILLHCTCSWLVY